ncbi:hypothetical protein QJQ45_012824 [Haematococcus lacustris]|nr:hypothetical protein QJQ45_012824 [Haematococcus lacustris]
MTFYSGPTSMRISSPCLSMTWPSWSQNPANEPACHLAVSSCNHPSRPFVAQEELNVAQARLAHQDLGAEQLQQSVVRLTAAVCAADARASAAEASSIAAAAVAASASSDAYASSALLEQELQLNAALLEETKLLHQRVAKADAATMAAMADAEDKGVRLRACMADSKQFQIECSNLMKRVARRDQALKELRAAQTAPTATAQEQEQPQAAASNCQHPCGRPHQTVQLCHTQVAAHATAAYKTSYLLRALQLLVACQLSFNKVQHAITSSLGLHLMPGQELIDRKGITLSHLKQLCVRLNLATKGAKSRIQCLKAISQHQQQQHQRAPAVATITPSKRHAPDNVMRMR